MAALLLQLMSSLPLSQSEIFDLAHVQTPLAVSFSVPYAREGVAGEGLGVYSDIGTLTAPEHSGTHMDAPNHFVEGGASLDKIPVEWTIADGVNIDCRREVSNNRSYQVTPQKLLEWELRNGQIPQGAAVLFQFGWSARYLDPQDYLGVEDLTDFFNYDFPTVSPEAGVWLLQERDIKIIGVDSISPDLFEIGGFPNHRLLLGANRLIVENLKIPDNMPARGFRFHATPPKYLNGTGIQVRAFAVTAYSDDVTDSGDAFRVSIFFFAVTMCLAKVIV